MPDDPGPLEDAGGDGRGRAAVPARQRDELRPPLAVAGEGVADGDGGPAEGGDGPGRGGVPGGEARGAGSGPGRGAGGDAVGVLAAGSRCRTRRRTRSGSAGGASWVPGLRGRVRARRADLEDVMPSPPGGALRRLRTGRRRRRMATHVLPRHTGRWIGGRMCLVRRTQKPLTRAGCGALWFMPRRELPGFAASLAVRALTRPASFPAACRAGRARRAAGRRRWRTAGRGLARMACSAGV